MLHAPPPGRPLVGRFRLYPRNGRPVSFSGFMAEKFDDGIFELRVFLTKELRHVVEVVQLDGPDGEETVNVIVVNPDRPQRTFRELGMSELAQKAYAYMRLDPTLYIE